MRAARVLFLLFLFLQCILGKNVVRVSLDRKAPHGHFFVDEYGRVRIFHGVNAVYKIPPYVPSSSGFDPVTTLSEKDADDLRAWGFNVVRLGVMWPGVAPQRGVTDQEYLGKVRELVGILHSRGIATLLDLHQDLGGRMLCGEGFPDWAVRPEGAKHAFPWPIFKHNFTRDEQGYPRLEECLQKSFANYYLTQAVSAAFQALYDNVDGIRDEFVRFWREVARAFRDVPGVVGYEIINEPWAGDVWKRPGLLIPGHADRANLYPLYTDVATAVRAEDPDAVIFFEKATTNVFGSLGFPTVPGGDAYRDRSVYSWHNYCGTVDRSGNPRSWIVCEGEQAAQLKFELHDIDSMRTGSFLTEFGAVSGNNSKSLQDLEWVLDAADRNIQSWAYWQFKSYNDITTASNERESFYWSDGSLQADKVDVLSRPYALAVAGTPSAHAYSRATRTFRLAYAALAPTPRDAPTVVYVGSFARAGVPFAVSIAPEGAASWSLSDDGLFVNIVNSKDLPDGTAVTVTISPK